MKRRAHIVYSGRVQGVGFRITAEETALRYRVCGWVKNLRDGRVELIAEAEERILRQFLQDLQIGAMGKFIHDASVSWSEPTDEFKGFEIRYF